VVLDLAGRQFLPLATSDKEVALFFSRSSIQRKLLVCLAIVLVIVAALAYSGFAGAYSYRELSRTIGVRATDLKLASELQESLSDLRFSLVQTWELRDRDFSDVLSGLDRVWLKAHFTEKLSHVEHDLRRYHKHLDAAFPSDSRFGDRAQERQAVEELEAAVGRLKALTADPEFDISRGAPVVQPILDEVYAKAGALQAQMHSRMHDYAKDVRVEYRTGIILEWTASIGALLFLPLAGYLLYQWLFQPLNVLITGSRRIAQQDDFDHRIHLKSGDEMAELAAALNDMTARFQEIRSDLDAQVKQRTREVVRSEQLASVGFLAAGVAHEINNPLASIAWCAESLESRLHDTLVVESSGPLNLEAADVDILRKYLRRIQDEAFRCKGITEKLLDFSRLGDVQRQETDLGDLVQGVIEMVRHLGKYRQKKIEFHAREYVVAPVNAQEIKQVLLNLITNALDSLEAGGTVRISLRRTSAWAELVVEDNGCGMSEEVLRHLFEPFFTRKRDGSGTGLGLSITWRIVMDHGGTIEPSSDGPGKGARVRVLLPLAAREKGQPERKPQRLLQAA
jgi:two-component system, NtrC family, sensor kinase